jgi:hypothetical protein
LCSCPANHGFTTVAPPNQQLSSLPLLLLTPHCSGEIKNTGSPVKNFVNRLNKAFETENVLTAPKGLADALTTQDDTTKQVVSDPFGASRKLLESPSKSKNAVRSALDEAAVKLSSVGTSLQDMTPRPLRAAGDDEWTLSTENPVFSEVNTPREQSENISTKNTPAKAQNDITTPTRSTPRSARTPGSAQKEDATGFPRSFPVKKPAGGYGLHGGLAGWMRKSSTLQDNKNEEGTVLGTSDISSNAGDDHSTITSGGLGDVLLMFLTLALVLGVVFLVPTTSLPSSVAAPLNNFRQQAATVTSPTGANLVALVSKMPQSIPRFTSTNLALSDLRHRAASTLRHFSSGHENSAVQEVKSVGQVAIGAVRAPLRLLGSAVAGVCLAVAMVAAVLQLQGAMPLSTLTGIFGSFSKGGGAGGNYENNNLMNGMDLVEEEQEMPSTSRKSTSARKTSRRAPPATPRSTRRLVSDDVDGGPRVPSTRKAWRRQDTA